MEMDVCIYIYIYIYIYMCVCVCVYVYIYVCVCIFLLHAPSLGVILHALLWYLQIQCLEISTMIISYYEISLICLV
jgi:hypothetical protein